MYDANPNLDKDSLALNITHVQNDLSVDLAIEVSEYFGIKKSEAKNRAEDMLKTIRDNWRIVASQNGLSKTAIEYMRPAFSRTDL